MGSSARELYEAGSLGNSMEDDEWITSAVASAHYQPFHKGGQGTRFTDRCDKPCSATSQLLSWHHRFHKPNSLLHLSTAWTFLQKVSYQSTKTTPWHAKQKSSSSFTANFFLPTHHVQQPAHLEQALLSNSHGPEKLKL